jgi:hypothetical protein
MRLLTCAFEAGPAVSGQPCSQFSGLNRPTSEETVCTALALALAIKTTKRRGGLKPQKFLALNGKPVMQACWKQKMLIDVKKK